MFPQLKLLARSLSFVAVYLRPNFPAQRAVCALRLTGISTSHSGVTQRLPSGSDLLYIQTAKLQVQPQARPGGLSV